MAMYPTIQGLFGLGEGGDAWESFVQGWASFTEWRELVPFLVNVALAVLLVLPLVYIRLGNGRAYELSTIEENWYLMSPRPTPATGVCFGANLSKLLQTTRLLPAVTAYVTPTTKNSFVCP